MGSSPLHGGGCIDRPQRGPGARTEPERSDSLKIFGALVQAFRKRAGLTQEQWADKSGYSLSTCAAIEQGRRFPPRRFIERAEEVLDAFGALKAAAAPVPAAGAGLLVPRVGGLGAAGTEPVHVRVPGRPGAVADGGVRAGP
ncbi:hypothetical protein GCM10009863_55240 [Streptomyces axinellae]|uniref:HTH cro/C1-type domain-containing protein n=1 Tax=Streptomyces axinellae TaxID=552788 RepID=A0ABP6D2M3_9ACTN